LSRFIWPFLPSLSQGESGKKREILFLSEWKELGYKDQYVALDNKKKIEIKPNQVTLGDSERKLKMLID